MPDPSKLFLADRRAGVAGSAVVPAMEGQRPLLVEVQALTVPIPPGTPARRNAQGLDGGRLALLLAVLERRAGLRVGDRGRLRVDGRRRAARRAGRRPRRGLAVASAVTDQPIGPDVVVFGEVGLGGEVRQVSHARRRLAEAARIGFRRAIVPGLVADRARASTWSGCSTVAEALAAVGIGRRSEARGPSP